MKKVNKGAAVANKKVDIKVSTVEVIIDPAVKDFGKRQFIDALFIAVGIKGVRECVKALIGKGYVELSEFTKVLLNKDRVAVPTEFIKPNALTKAECIKFLDWWFGVKRADSKEAAKMNTCCMVAPYTDFQKFYSQAEGFTKQRVQYVKFKVLDYQKSLMQKTKADGKHPVLIKVKSKIKDKEVCIFIDTDTKKPYSIVGGSDDVKLEKTADVIMGNQFHMPTEVYEKHILPYLKKLKTVKVVSEGRVIDILKKDTHYLRSMYALSNG